jgi:hypothetical protein
LLKELAFLLTPQNSPKQRSHFVGGIGAFLRSHLIPKAVHGQIWVRTGLTPAGKIIDNKKVRKLELLTYEFFRKHNQ